VFSLLYTNIHNAVFALQIQDNSEHAAYALRASTYALRASASRPADPKKVGASRSVDK